MANMLLPFAAPLKICSDSLFDKRGISPEGGDTECLGRHPYKNPLSGRGFCCAKSLKFPNSTYSTRKIFIVGVLAATTEVLVPRVVASGLGRTPVVGTSKTTHNVFLKK